MRPQRILIVVMAMAVAQISVNGQGSSPQTGTSTLRPALVERTIAWVSAFEREFSALVAEERFEQRAVTLGWPTSAITVTRSDFLLVRRPHGEDWIPFRDVFEVNGRPVRDRGERLQKLFLDRPASAAFEEAAQITRESSRYNTGSVIRTINVPTFALMLLQPVYVNRFEFRQQREELIEGSRVSRIDFTERRSPTIVKTSRGSDVRLEGSFWVDPESGRVIRTMLKTAGTPDPGKPNPPLGVGETLMRVIVTFTPNERDQTWIPASMEEWARAVNGSEVFGFATYSNVRRFRVDVIQKFVTPSP